MIAARNDHMIRDVGQSVAIDDKSRHLPRFEVVKEFVYLGSLITPTNDVNLEIQRRIQTANRCFFGLQTSEVEPPFTPNKIHHSQIP
jgi:hypothetical protein